MTKARYRTCIKRGCGKSFEPRKDVDTRKSFAARYCAECEKALPINPVITEATR